MSSTLNAEVASRTDPAAGLEGAQLPMAGHKACSCSVGAQLHIIALHPFASLCIAVKGDKSGAHGGTAGGELHRPCSLARFAASGVRSIGSQLYIYIYYIYIYI